MDFSFFKNILSKPTDSVVGVDIGSAFIKVVQLRKIKGRVALDTYGELALAPYDNSGPIGGITNFSPEELVEPLSKIFEEARVTATNASIAIPSRESLIFTLKFPKLKEKDLIEAVKNESKRHIPVPLSEVTLDWWVIPKFGASPKPEEVDKEIEINVLVAAVRNDFLSKHKEIFSSNKNIVKQNFELDIFGAVRSSLKHELSPSIVLDFGASGVRFAVVEYGIMKKFHSINRGGYNLSDAISAEMGITFEEAEDLKKKYGLRPEEGNANSEKVANVLRSNLGFFFNELRNFLLNFERIEERPVRKIVLIGGGALLKGLNAEIEADFNIETLLANPFGRAEAPEFLEEILSEAGPEFAVAFGHALKPLE